MQQQAKGRIRGAERQSRDARLLQRAQALHQLRRPAKRTMCGAPVSSR